ncbi:sugar ABC transporter substrate-binding protein [Acrocarpospora macrocephala]|uniref:Ribose ABC transporter substrate-binding protein n=1 Tax=Acrocarpospora macrocephala TaxID=150177 RepID=A0A5M3WIV4_9ACTN|nr:sugar ABC transporter substrate-binding protein [Acrocarpospora macrocephala]GES09107.1 ribose ABC transporter substrate-binding protein [Acrocarpospora macrocephala]
MNLHRYGRLLVAAVALAVVAACGSPASETPATQAAGTGKLKIALSNSFIGNQWRVEMENVFKAACAMPPYVDQVECSVFNAGNDVSTQSRQISNLISQGVDGIVINAASTSGLNGVVQQACDRGIVVVSFDNTVDAACGLTVNTDQVKFGQQLAQFIVDELNGQGKVIMVTGVAGTGADNDRNKGAMEVFAANPGIEIVATYSGMWDSATAQRATSGQLPSLPKIDGVWVSGGTDGVIKAFSAAKRPMPVVGGEAENGFRKYMAGILTPKVNGMSIGQPPFLSVISLELARGVIKKEHPKESITIPFPVVTSDTLVPGETVFPDLPDSFFADFTDSGPNATVILCQQAATDGTPCPGKTLDVNFGKR